jgi:hypothetical protein
MEINMREALQALITRMEIDLLKFGISYLCNMSKLIKIQEQIYQNLV